MEKNEFSELIFLGIKKEIKPSLKKSMIQGIADGDETIEGLEYIVNNMKQFLSEMIDEQMLIDLLSANLSIDEISHTMKRLYTEIIGEIKQENIELGKDKEGLKCIWCDNRSSIEKQKFCPNCGIYQVIDGEFEDDGIKNKCLLCKAENQMGVFCTECGTRLLIF